MILLRNKWRFFFFKTTDYIKKLRIFIFWGFIINSFIIIFLEIPNFFWFFDPYVILIRAFILKTWFIIFIMIIVINIFFPRIWCYTICPLGYLNYLLGVKLRNKIKKKTKWIEKNF
jgi:polyferredoxin